jgi:hypothetical protein
MSNITIYTANTGCYDKNREDILVFKEYNKFISSRLNAKIYKILFYQFVNTEWSIWIDASVHLKVTPDYLVNLAGDSDICVFKHPRRNCIYHEAIVCKNKKLDYDWIIDQQILKYRNQNYPENNGLAECTILIRRNTEEIRNLSDRWWSEICTGSWRDQISFPVVFQNANIKYIDPGLKEEIYIKKQHIKDRTINSIQ